MSNQVSLEVLPKAPFRTSNGIAYCIWSYKISWDVAGTPPTGRVGIVLPQEADIQDPQLYPEEPALQGTTALLSGAGNKIYISAIAPVAPASEIVIPFITPYQSNPSTA